MGSCVWAISIDVTSRLARCEAPSVTRILHDWHVAVTTNARQSTDVVVFATDNDELVSQQVNCVVVPAIGNRTRRGLHIATIS